MKPFIGMFVLLCATSVSAQTVTPKQAESIAILKPHQYRAPVVYTGPTVIVLSTKTPTLGPWEFPEPLPARRLDGSLLSDPPTVYGLPAFWPFFVPSSHPQHRR